MLCLWHRAWHPQNQPPAMPPATLRSSSKHAACDITEAQAVTRAYRSPLFDNREVLIGAQTSCGAEALRGAGALAREHSGKGTTSVLEPALSEAEGAEQLPFLIVIPSGFSREESAADDPARTNVADASIPEFGATLRRSCTSQFMLAYAT